MLTKEKVAQILRSVARVFPGIPSYQERDGLRTQDKIIREMLASRISEQAQSINQIISELTSRAMLTPLASLDTLSRKLMRLSDTIRFASYGYTGLFSGTPVDEQKLAQLYDYDLSLHQEIEELAVAVSTLRQLRVDEWGKDSLQDFQELLYRLEEKINNRKTVFVGK